MAPYGGEPRRGFDVTEAIERQHGEVGGMPDQDWSLRVTLVFQYEGTEWQLVHRHHDPTCQPTNA